MRQVPGRRVREYVKRLYLRLAISLLGATFRERKQIRAAIASIQGLMPVLMKPRNGQSWTVEDRKQILTQFRRLSAVSPYLLVIPLPGLPFWLPLFAWWVDRRRKRWLVPPRRIMGRGRVLVVDDESDIRMSVRLVLTKAGYDVLEAEDGEQAIAVVKSGDNPLLLNAIICDLEMPKVNGMQAITFFRAQFPSTPVIVLTGTGTIGKATTLFKQGVVEFLTKPIEPGKLTAVLSKVVQQSGYRDDHVT